MKGLTLKRSLLAVSAVCVAGIGGLVNCASDEDTSVVIVTNCNLASLRATDVSEATVKTYHDTASEFLRETEQLIEAIKTECNTMNAALGLPTGATMKAACNTIAARVKAANDLIPVPDGGFPVGTVPAPWVSVRFADDCIPDPNAERTCIDGCSGKPACDQAAACPPDQRVGTCSGECTGLCFEQGVAAGSCVGACEGRTEMGFTDAGAPPQCAGVCEGTCAANAWTGNCAAGCTAGFVGLCAGTCTGVCEGAPINVQDNDAGADAGPMPPPTNADGNCKGVCRGQCSSNASGSCTARCQGAFAGGACGNCVGTCISTSQASVQDLTRCTGSCTSSKATCPGTCTGACSNSAPGFACKVGLNCDANDQCKRACRLKGLFASKCDAPPSVEVRAAGDALLLDVFTKHGPAFAKLVKEVSQLRFAVLDLADRTTGDFEKIGVVRLAAFKCVDEGKDVYRRAQANYNELVSVSKTIQGTAY